MLPSSLATEASLCSDQQLVQRLKTGQNAVSTGCLKWYICIVSYQGSENTEEEQKECESQ